MLGFGSLGLTGPKEGTLLDYNIIRNRKFTHSEWFSPENFNNTMKEIWTY
jgi:hypothetical protein